MKYVIILGLFKSGTIVQLLILNYLIYFDML